MAETIEELTVDYTDPDGQQLVKQLDKQILSKGSWTTIIYLYQEWDRRKESWSAPKARLERYQKRKGVIRSQSRFKISSAKQGRAVAAALLQWFPEGGDDGDGADEE